MFKLFTLRESRRPTWILQHLKTCRHFLICLNPFYDWLFAAGCLLLAANCLHAGYWALLVAPNCNACEIYVFPWKMKPNKLQKLQNWGQNYTKMTPNGLQNRPFEGLGALLKVLGGLFTFLIFFGAILGSILRVFWGQKAWQNNQNFVKQM